MRLRVTEAGATRTVQVRGDRAVLGRSPECEVPLEDTGVSRRHAEIEKEGEGWRLRDLGSRNGTFVNDRPIERAWVSARDAIRLGPDVDVVLLDAPTRDTSRNEDFPGDEDGSSSPDRATRKMDERRRAGPSWLTRVTWRLEPSAAGSPVQRLTGGATTVGRDPSAGIMLEDDSVSRIHARLEARAGELVVTDLKSRNGTHVGDAPVLQASLAPDDTVRFGDVEFRVTRKAGPHWGRLGLLVGVLAAVVASVLLLARLSDRLGERSAVADTARRMRQQAVENTRAGIEASRVGDPELARAYLIHAADLMLLADLAPRGATLDRPTELFRGLMRDLPEADREFDFVAALDPAAVASSEARLATLTNREYLDHQLRRYAVELNQDPNVPHGFSERVWTFVEQHEQYPASMRAMLRRARDVQPRIRGILATRHLPEAFCYVAWVESGLDPMRLSPVGALGLWQLMPGTARELGLDVAAGDLRADLEARRRDQRTEIERSTAAAADYIARLLRDQGPEHFMLVLASYNRGPGAVDRAKQKVTDPMLSATRKFWYLSEHGLLPAETRDYVPRIMAVRLIAEAPQRFGFESP